MFLLVLLACGRLDLDFPSDTACGDTDPGACDSER